MSVSKEKKEVQDYSVFDCFNDLVYNSGNKVYEYYKMTSKIGNGYNYNVINQTLANFEQTVELANELNKIDFYHTVPQTMHFLFLYCLNLPRGFKQFYKKDKNLVSDINLLAQAHNCSVKEMYKLVSAYKKEDLEEELKRLKNDTRNK